MLKVNSKKVLKEFLSYESKKYGLKSYRYPFLAIRENKLLYRINYLLRHLEYYTNCNKKVRKLLCKLYYLKIQRKYGTFLPINVFDKGLLLVHIGSRLVNGKSEVGKDCVMHINTYLVAGGVNDYAPKIGDNCILAVGSGVVGKAILGDNVVVGAGAVVNKNFEEGNITIGGIPAVKISNKNSKDWWNKKKSD